MLPLSWFIIFTNIHTYVSVYEGARTLSQVPVSPNEQIFFLKKFWQVGARAGERGQIG